MLLSIKNRFNCDNFLVLYKCKLCDFDTNEKTRHLSHICGVQDKSEVIYNECDQCSIGSHSILYIQHHRSRHQNHRSESDEKELQKLYKKFICSQCCFATSVEKYLRNHLKLEHKSDYKMIQVECKICKWRSRTIPHSQHPIVCKHTKGKERKLYQCTECRFKTFNTYDLKRHKMDKHTPNHLAKWYKCSICNFKSKRSTYIKTHMERMHKNKEVVKQFKCDQCKYATNANKDFKRHVKAMHSTEITWISCKECSYKAKRRQHMGKHMGKHTVAKHSVEERRNI